MTMDALIQDKRIDWSRSKDRSSVGAGRTVLEMLQQAAPDIQRPFFDVLGGVRGRLNRHERIEVQWWYAPLAYIKVINTRWKHYPCKMRMLLSFDLENGKFAPQESISCFAFARAGWRALASSVLGYEVSKFPDCGQPDESEPCSKRSRISSHRSN
jgi:hypothetical protein